MNDIVNSIVGEEWQYCDHPSILYEGRNRIGALIDELGGLVNLT